MCLQHSVCVLNPTFRVHDSPFQTLVSENIMTISYDCKQVISCPETRHEVCVGQK